MNLRDAFEASRALWRTFGARGLYRRSVFEVRRNVGHFRTDPIPVGGSVSSAEFPLQWPFVVDSDAVRHASEFSEAMGRANRVVGGEHQAYRWQWRRLPRTAREWHRHPESGAEYDQHMAWFRIPHFDPVTGDIKDMWEPGRFSYAYDLVRGFLLTRQELYAEAFWTNFEMFSEANPPFRGVHWSCGQETSIRAIAWLWAEGALSTAECSTSQRLACLRQSLVRSAERIEDAIGYALSQRNNHGISETTGLIAIAARFGEAEPRANRWLRNGSRWLDQLVCEQFARDGWYIQHSFNYTRLALDQLVVARRALRSVGRDLSHESISRVRAAVRLLFAVMDLASGKVPNHGANDGAYVLPLSTRPYEDFRPSLTAASVTFEQPLPPAFKPDAETLAWLGIPSMQAAASGHTDPVVQGQSGWVSASTGGVRVFARAGAYSSRPGHIDPLHVDVWIDGRAVAVDAGTYRYAAAPPWNNGLADIRVHNTLTLRDLPPARRGPRFLWLSWPRAEIGPTTGLGQGNVTIDMTNSSWLESGIIHRRSCHLSPGGLVVLDTVIGPEFRSDSVILHWLLDGEPEDLLVLTWYPSERNYTRGDPETVSGWVSEFYGTRRPATSVRVSAQLVNGRFLVATGFGNKRVHGELEDALKCASEVLQLE